jgi:hypothetical protein
MIDGPIWDLRNGDADDNRVSPKGGGLRSLILSAALEFNYLKAAIGFVALIMGPAVLIGAIPPLVFTFGRLKLHAAASVPYTPGVAIVTLVVLVGLVLWIGRPLLSTLIEKFWQLHYSFVFPLFVTFREILRSVAEWFPGQTDAREAVERRRRLGNVVGALLIAGGGLALAARVGLSTRLQITGMERADVWGLLSATLGNAAVILGLSACVESLYWVWRELRFRGSVADWSPDASDPGAPVVRVAHISDPHFVGEAYGYRMESGTRGPRGNERIRAGIQTLAEIHCANPVDRILITGDVTDAGTRAEWAEFADTLEAFPELKARLSFVPGNHDVNIVDRSNPGRFDLPWSMGQPLRQFRTVLALDMFQGARAHVVDRETGTLGPTLSEYLRSGNRADRLRSLAAHAAFCGRREMARVWDAIFPLVELPQEGAGCGVILLNSNARSHFSLTNAIGVVNPSQLKAMKSILCGFPQTPWLIALHHQVVEYPSPSIPLTDRVGLALVNAPDVLDVVAMHSSRCVILHGHRHRDWIGTCSGVVLCSAPSLTLGGNFFIHELETGPGSLRLRATRRVPAGLEIYESPAV